ncbi:hypothetical protein Tco_0778174 [Tanacetum coccineum]
MSGTIPPILPPLGSNPGNTGSPNRVDSIPVDNTNNTTTTNVVQNVLYTPEFSESLQENTGYWQQPGPYEATTQTSPTKKKKATRNRQKRQVQTDDAPRQVAWTTEEEIALARGWKSVSKNSERGNARKKDGFWVEVIEYIESKSKMEGRRTYDMESGARDEDYVQKAMGSSKRHKSSGSRASSTMNDDALARLVVNEMTAVEVEQREVFIELKRREVECRKREIAATEYRAQQEDMKLYLQSYDHLTGKQRLTWDEVRAKIKAKYNLQF